MKSQSHTTTALTISILLNLVLIILLFWMAGQRGEAASDIVVEQAVSPEPTDGIAEPSPDATVTPVATEIAEVEQPTEEATSIAPSPTPESDSAPTQTPTSEPLPTETPTPTPSPTATATPAPTETPTPEPTPTVVVFQGPAWLQYLNQFRVQAGLAPVREDPALSDGSRLHSTYVAKTGRISHYEDPNSPFYTKAGSAAGENGNLAATIISATEFDWAFNYWISAPFHGIPALDPQLSTVGFGTYREAGAPVEVVSTLDIKRGLLSEVPAPVSYPVLFPKDGGQAWVLRYSLPEFPDGRPHCGYGSVSGAPIVVQIGSGDQVPNVVSTRLTLNGQFIEHCVFDETNYFNSNPNIQQTGRLILDQRDAIVILPRNPLVVGNTYEVEVVVNGETIAWSFDTVKPPQLP